MPYLTDKIKLPPELDRRIKVLPEDREEIVRLHQGGMSIRAITRQFKVNRRTIQFILFPERLVASRKNRDWRRYYDREKNNAAIQNTRLYKHRVLDTNIEKREKLN